MTNDHQTYTFSFSTLQTYIALSKYARWLDDKKRREYWDETVKRYIDFWRNRLPELASEFDGTFYETLEKSIYLMEVMPSMRALMTAGKALERDEIAGYNCSGLAINHIRCFDEMFYIALCGCGTGFSVERQYLASMPEVAEEFFPSDSVIVVSDSKIGWAAGLKELISMLYQGAVPKWDLSKIRPKGSRLKTFGGRASGPEPLNLLFKNTVKIFQGSKGRRLNSIECHDLCCHILSSVVVGGVRRSSAISLSNLTDDRMRRAKDGQWWDTAPHRALANNSVAYTEKPDLDSFSKEWRILYKSKSGERGIWNKVAAKRIAEANGRVYDGDYLTNPCGETSLRDTGGLCNLSEVIIRETDSFEEISRKVEMATILGTLQSTLTNFRYLRKIWKTNAEEERLLGVSFTGIMDHPVMSGTKRNVSEWSGNPEIDSLEKVLENLRNHAYTVNKHWAEKLGINPSKHIGVVKPSGTVSLLTNTSSGIHPRYAKYYIRRVTQDIKDPLTQMMIDQGIPHVFSNGNVLFTFYVRAPKTSIIQKDIGALRQLELWKKYKECWCDGNPSQTIYYTDNEYFAVADWVWNNWDIIGGLSFFPTDDNIYENPPMEEISYSEYTEGIKSFPVVDWSKLSEYEAEDNTTSAQFVACSGGACELG